MNKYEMLRAIDIFKIVSKERKQMRRKLCRFIRENMNKGKYTDFWLQRKCDRNYLGDLTDPQLIYYVESICEVLEDK